MSTTLTATFPNGSTQTLVVDSITREDNGESSTITKHPVEKGANVADHQRPEPVKHKYELIFTNTPFGSSALPGHAEAARRRLTQWRLAGALLSFPTTTGKVRSLAIENISHTRDAKTGGNPARLTGGLRVSLSLEQIRIVQNKTTTTTLAKTGQNAASESKVGKTPVNPLDQDSPLLTTVKTGNAVLQKITGG